MDNFDTNIVELVAGVCTSAVEVDENASVKESPFVFNVAHGVIGPVSGLSRLEIVVVMFLSRSVFQPPCGWKF